MGLSTEGSQDGGMLDVFIVISSLIRTGLFLFLSYFPGTFRERFKKYITNGVTYKFPFTIFRFLLYRGF